MGRSVFNYLTAGEVSAQNHTYMLLPTGPVPRWSRCIITFVNTYLKSHGMGAGSSLGGGIGAEKQLAGKW